ncbi:MAG TPA: carbon storage regulator [Luteibacter sp.]|jgi:carbon storage regulator CsrA|nr:carbon storage regulator [Luteibacter sp.]
MTDKKKHQVDMGNLHISRCEGESFVIGDDIVVTVVTIRGNAIRLSVSAPREVAVRRMPPAPKTHI